MSKILRVDDQLRSEIKKVKEYSYKNILDEHALLAIKEKISPDPKNNPNHIVNIFQNFKAVYTVDTIDGALYHHLCLTYKDGCPSIPEAVIIMDLFGLGKDINDLDSVWLEQENFVVNLLKKIDDDTNADLS